MSGPEQHTPHHSLGTLSHSHTIEQANLRQTQQATQRPGLDRVSPDRSDANVPGTTSLQQYPIRARRDGHDPLVEGIAAIGTDLGPTLLPVLQQPMPKGPDNIGAPNCRGVTGTRGTMVQVMPKQNLHITTIPLDLDVTSPIYPTPRPFIQSPTVLQSPDGSVHSPTGIRKSPPQASQPTSTPAPPKSAKKGDDEFKTEFRFVVNEDAKTARNTVRQHVMREYRRRERWESGRNKVSKAKRPSKKDSKESKNVVIKTEPEPQTPTLPQPPQQIQTPLQTSFSSNSDASVRRESTSGDQVERRHSQSMSISDQSDAGSDSQRFASLVAEGNAAQPTSPKTRPPFAQYVDQGVILQPRVVEDAVEEIERVELQTLPYQQDPWAEIARAQINPFSSHLNVGAGAASQALLHHYAWVMPSLMDEIVTGTVFHRIGWLYSSVAVHDPTPYHTIVGFTLGHIAMLRGIDEPAMAMEHKERSLQLINRRLANPAMAASDESIGGIANIAAYELIDCNPDRFAMHMQGLARLVTQRGGISGMSSNPALETVLIRLDIIRAYMTISQPRFPTWASLRNITPLAINIGPPAIGSFLAPKGYDMHQYLFGEDAIRLIHGLEDVLMLMRSLSPFIPFTPDPAFKSLLIDSTIHHLRRNLFDVPSSFSNHPCRRAVRLAAIVLIDIAAAEFFQPKDRSPPHPPQPSAADSNSNPSQLPHGNLNSNQPERSPGSAEAPKDKKGLGLTRLRARFPSIEQNRHLWGRSVEMIVAVLMQAERVALERPFRAWYVADIVTITMKLGEADWHAVENALMNDLVARVVQDRSKATPQNGIRNDSNDQPVWDLDETVRRFWGEWSQ